MFLYLLVIQEKKLKKKKGKKDKVGREQNRQGFFW